MRILGGLLLGGAIVGAGLLGGCSKSDAAGKTAGGASGSAGAGGGGTAGSGGSANGPAITSAPDAWAPPADCGGIGNLCPNLSGCGAQSTCQLEGNVCIPSFPTNATSLPGKTAETPYCAAYTCMTFEQASCFCTGPAGATNGNCSSPSALAGLCVGEGSGCNTTACCTGLTCTEGPSAGSKLCKKACSSASDCTSGCCTDLYDTGTMICADAAACANPCKKQGDSTCDPGSSTTPNNCCRGSCVQSDVPDYAGCRPDCVTNADCDTGCCSPYAGGASGFCVSAQLCMCLAAYQPCGATPEPCCAGSECIGYTATDLTCSPYCNTNADCMTNCCLPVTGETVKVCVATSHCG